MEIESIKKFLDACQEAKRITELMPELPKGMKPRHIHVLDAVHSLSKKGEAVRVRDVSESLKVTMPSVTKLVNELEALGAVAKSVQAEDKRAVALVLTPLGESYYDFYVAHYHSWLAQLLQGLTDAEILAAAQVMQEVYQLMAGQQMEKE